MVEGMPGFTVSTADRMATFGVPSPKSGVEVDGVLDDVALRQQIRRDVHRGIGDEQRLRMVRNVHHEDVADTPGGAKSSLPLRDCPQQLIRMQASFHQQLGFARANELDRFLRRRLAVRGVDDVDALDVEIERLCEARKSCPWGRRELEQ